MFPALAGDFWQNFGNGLDQFFRHGMGGPGAKGIGITILVIGIVFACVSFAVHKFNPQSKLPGWFMCLCVALAGSVLMGGIDGPMSLINQARDTLYGWFGISSST